MALKPEISIPAALAVVVGVYGIYQINLPPVADARTIESGNMDLSSAEREATWEAAALVSGISLIARDPAIFVVGSAAVIVLAWKYRHADAVSPLTKKASAMFTVEDVVQAQEPMAAPAGPYTSQAPSI